MSGTAAAAMGGDAAGAGAAVLMTLLDAAAKFLVAAIAILVPMLDDICVAVVLLLSVRSRESICEQRVQSKSRLPLTVSSPLRSYFLPSLPRAPVLCSGQIRVPASSAALASALNSGDASAECGRRVNNGAVRSTKAVEQPTHTTRRAQGWSERFLSSLEEN